MTSDATLINLTPHNVTVAGVEFPASGQIARVEEIEPTATGTVLVGDQELPVVTVRTGRVVGLPPEKEGTYYIVSRMVAENAPHRRDLLIPHGLLRDDAGRVIGCSGFGQVPGSEPLAWDDPTFGGEAPYGPSEVRVARADSGAVRAKVAAIGCDDHDGACSATVTLVAEFGSTDDARDWAEDAAHRAATGTYTRR